MMVCFACHDGRIASLLETCTELRLYMQGLQESSRCCAFLRPGTGWPDTRRCWSGWGPGPWSAVR